MNREFLLSLFRPDEVDAVWEFSDLIGGCPTVNFTEKVNDSLTLKYFEDGFTLVKRQSEVLVERDGLPLLLIDLDEFCGAFPWVLQGSQRVRG